MATSFIDEYLVKLGAGVDQSGMQRFYQALHQATSVTESSAHAMTMAFFKAQTEIVGGFAAIGVAALGLASKVAMADQSYRLFAMHMYMSKENARGLKVAMDALGEPLENLTWDKELRDRTHQLLADQRAMAPDGDFDDKMKKLRDIQFQFTRMEVEFQYLTMHVVNDFLKALGLGPDTLLDKLSRFNDWVTTHLPDISNKFVTLFLPVWKDIKVVAEATGHALAEASVAFTNIVGLLTGDNSIMGTTFDMEKLAGAVVHVANGFASFAKAIANVEEMVAHLVSALALLIHGDFSGAGKELGAALHSISKEVVGATVGGVSGGLLGGGVGATLGGLAGGAVGGLFGPAGIPIGAAIGSSLFGTVGATTGAVGGSFIGSAYAGHRGNSYEALPNGSVESGPTPMSSDGGGISELLDKYAARYGVNSAVLHALSQVESRQRQFDSKGELVHSVDENGKTIAVGAMQLTDATARTLGVDRTSAEGNVEGGARLFSQLLEKYKDKGGLPVAIGAYHEGETKMDKILTHKASLSNEARDEISKVMRLTGAQGDVQVGSIVIHIDKPNATNEDVGRAVETRLRAMQQKKVQRNLAELNDLGWS